MNQGTSERPIRIAIMHACVLCVGVHCARCPGGDVRAVHTCSALPPLGRHAGPCYGGDGPSFFLFRPVFVRRPCRTTFPLPRKGCPTVKQAWGVRARAFFVGALLFGSLRGIPVHGAPQECCCGVTVGVAGWCPMQRAKFRELQANPPHACTHTKAKPQGKTPNTEGCGTIILFTIGGNFENNPNNRQFEKQQLISF